MYIRYDDDDDCDSVRTRGQDLRNRLRRAAQATSAVDDPVAREAINELLEAMRLISDILYDVCEPPERRLVAITPQHARYSLS
jgi:hypothetical protein